VGNEWEHYVYHKDLTGLGGGYVGVGSDQGYLFAAWMRARYAWLIDYDDAVVATHWVYRAFFLAADSPDRFVDLWAKRSTRSSLELLSKTYAGHPRLKFFKDVFLRSRRRVSRRLRGVRGRMRRHKVPCFLTRQKQYDYVRDMIRARRIRPMLVNLLERQGLIGIGQAARKLSVPIRAIYLSNAEEHWKKYTRQYRKNVLALQFDNKSIVLRTMSINSERSAYSYHVQPALNYVDWVKARHIRRVSYIKRREVRRARGVRFYIADQKPPKPWRRKHQKRRRR
jgi:hypothetical protein